MGKGLGDGNSQEEEWKKAMIREGSGGIRRNMCVCVGMLDGQKVGGRWGVPSNTEYPQALAGPVGSTL